LKEKKTEGGGAKIHTSKAKIIRNDFQQQIPRRSKLQCVTDEADLIA